MKPPRLQLQLQLQLAEAGDGDSMPGAGLGDNLPGAAPPHEQIEAWASAALKKIGRSGGELTVRVVGRAEMIALNQRYRGKTGATNVLSFPFEAIQGVPLNILGDIVICPAVVAAEAVAQQKSLMAHWAHMVVHATLHLCGFDHQQTAEAERMEALEQAILANLEPRARQSP